MLALHCSLSIYPCFSIASDSSLLDFVRCTNFVTVMVSAPCMMTQMSTSFGWEGKGRYSSFR